MYNDQYEANQHKLEGEEETQETFKIDSDELAEWAMLKIKDNQEEFDRIKTLCNRMIIQYQDRILEAEKQYHRNTDYFKGQLKNYFDTVKTKETKTQKSYSLGLGKLVLKKQKPKADIDNDILRDWLINKGHDEFVEVIEKPKWGEFKKTLIETQVGYTTSDGELVEGVELQEREDKFDVII